MVTLRQKVEHLAKQLDIENEEVTEQAIKIAELYLTHFEGMEKGAIALGLWLSTHLEGLRLQQKILKETRIFYITLIGYYNKARSNVKLWNEICYDVLSVHPDIGFIDKKSLNDTGSS